MIKNYYLGLVSIVLFVGCLEAKGIAPVKGLEQPSHLMGQFAMDMCLKEVDKIENGYATIITDDRKMVSPDRIKTKMTVGENRKRVNGKRDKIANESQKKKTRATFVANKTLSGNKIEPGNDTVEKKQTDSGSDPSDKVTNETKKGAKRLIVGWGDSLTAGAGGNGVTYLTTLQGLLGNGYEVINCGVGGETAATIAARQGGVPAYLKKGFVLPETTEEVIISKNSAKGNTFTNKYGKQISPLIQGDGYSVNPCYIKGLKCTLSYDYLLKNWKIRRDVASKQKTTVAANTPLTFYGAKAYRNPYAQIIWMGQNEEGHSSNEQLIEYYRSMIEFTGSKNYVVIGLHTGTRESRAALEKDMAEAFGQNYINWREYICSVDALKDAGLKPTDEDLKAIAEGYLPPAFWSTKTDAVHVNAICYKLLGQQVYKRCQLLGIIK